MSLFPQKMGQLMCREVTEDERSEADEEMLGVSGIELIELEETNYFTWEMKWRKKEESVEKSALIQHYYQRCFHF